MLTTFTNESFMVQNYDLNQALVTLQKGELILYPTDTIWSIGCDATNEDAVLKLRSLSKRNHSYPIELLFSSIDMIKAYVDHLHPRLETLLVYHVQPLTILLENPRRLPTSLFSTEGTVAIRLVQDSYCQELIEQFGFPIVAACASSAESHIPSSFGSVSSEYIRGVDYVVKHRQMEKAGGQLSVMVKLSAQDELIFLRE
ncbi:MAG: Sua5/YciO/YrdC/YwlC family protein [Saprospiraceae bacterium]|nr:Sua5/YciO/YrdC/YwlC family protein [Saprospiraceae bacterium]